MPSDVSESLYLLTCGPEHAALIYTHGDHVCDQLRLVSSICLAVSPAVASGSCGPTYLSVFITVNWLR